MIKTDSLSFSYAQQPVLSDINVTCPTGAITVVLGPNGSGKSSLLKCMTLPHFSYSGEVMVSLSSEEHHVPLRTLSRDLRQKAIAWMSSELEVTTFFTGLEIVMLGQPQEDKDKAMYWLTWCGCGDEAYRPYVMCSAGQQQRIQLARVLAQDTPVIVLDEPLSHMDIQFQVRTMTRLKELAKETQKTIVMASHQLEFCVGYCDVAILLKEGKVEASGPTSQVASPAQLHAFFGLGASLL